VKRNDKLHTTKNTKKATRITKQPSGHFYHIPDGGENESGRLVILVPSW